MPGQNLKYADEFAADYDNSVLFNNWAGPQLIFELLHPLLKPKADILDLGIGTGESSKLFQQAKHKILGIDGSAKMLEQCRKKNIGTKLVHHNLEEIPYPLENNQFDAVISNCVFHIVHPLKPVFAEVKRMLKPKGIFLFTYENTDQLSGSSEIEDGIWEKKTETGVLTYKHNSTYIQNLLSLNGFRTKVEKQFLAFQNKENNTKFYFNAVVAQLQ